MSSRTVCWLPCQVTSRAVERSGITTLLKIRVVVPSEVGGKSREHASHGTMAVALSHTAAGGMFVEDVGPRTIVNPCVSQDMGPQGVGQMSVPAPARSQGVMVLAVRLTGARAAYFSNHWP